MLTSAVGEFAPAAMLTVFGLIALWLAADTRRAISALVAAVGAFYFWLPGRRALFARVLERNLRHAGLWRLLGLLIIAGYIVTLALKLTLPTGLWLPH